MTRRDVVHFDVSWGFRRRTACGLRGRPEFERTMSLRRKDITCLACRRAT